jgi:hypothetical protein
LSNPSLAMEISRHRPCHGFDNSNNDIISLITRKPRSGNQNCKTQAQAKKHDRSTPCRSVCSLPPSLDLSQLAISRQQCAHASPPIVCRKSQRYLPVSRPDPYLLQPGTVPAAGFCGLGSGRLRQVARAAALSRLLRTASRYPRLLISRGVSLKLWLVHEAGRRLVILVADE